MDTEPKGEPRAAGTPVARRDVLNLLGGGAVLASAAAACAGVLRALVPNLTYEPPVRFTVGRPDDFPDATVTFLPERNIFVARDGNAFHAISAICTHLGCVVAWVDGEREFHCPCHGSRFGADGARLAGPAPQPLPWLQMTRQKDALVVDKSVHVESGQTLTV